MIIDVLQPTFEIKKDNPTIVRYEPEIKGEYIIEMKNNPYRPIIVQYYNNYLPSPKEGEILYRYTNKRGYLLKINLLNETK